MSEQVLTMRGLKEVLTTFRTMPPNVRKAYIAAVQEQGGKIMTESLKQCPIDVGNLRNSHFTDVQVQADGVRVILGYRSEYAVPVHEVPPSEASHNPPTKWKYLEDPLKAATPGFSERVALAVQSVLRGGK